MSRKKLIYSVQTYFFKRRHKIKQETKAEIVTLPPIERGDFVKGKSAIPDTKQERCVILGEYIIDNSATVRSTAGVFGISKSTVHQDVTVRLAKINPQLCGLVREVLQKNKDERHIRGGMATKKKYLELSELSKKYEH